MIFNLIKLAIDIEDLEERNNVISLIKDEDIKGFLEIEIFVKDNFSNFIYNFYNLYIKMDPLAVFSSLNLSKFNFREEIFNKDINEIKNILEKTNEIKLFLYYLENHTFSDFIKKVAAKKILERIKDQFAKISESAKTNFELYSEEIKKEVEEIIDTCLIVISKKDNKNLSELSEEILWETRADKFIDDKNIEEQLDFDKDKETIQQIKSIFKNNLAELISDYVNDQSKLEYHIKGFNNFFKSDYFFESMAGIVFEDFVKFTNLNSFLNHFVLSNKKLNNKKIKEYLETFKDQNHKIIKFLSKEALTGGIFKISNNEIKSAVRELLKNAKFIFTTDPKKDSDLEKAFGLYGIDKFEYDIKNLIIINLKGIVKNNPGSSSKIKNNLFFSQIQQTVNHEFEHYLDSALPKYFLLKKVRNIKTEFEKQFLKYKNNQEPLIRMLKLYPNFVVPSMYFEKRIQINNLKKKIIKRPELDTSAFNKDIITLAKALNNIYSRGDQTIQQYSSGIFLDEKTADTSEILVRINSLRRVFGGNKEKFKELLFNPLMDVIAKSYVPSDGMELMLIANYLYKTSNRYDYSAREFIEKLIELV